MSRNYFEDIRQSALLAIEFARRIPFSQGLGREAATREAVVRQQNLSDAIEFLLSQPPPRLRPQYWRQSPSGVTSGPFGGDAWAWDVLHTLRKLDKACDDLLKVLIDAPTIPTFPPQIDPDQKAQQLREYTDGMNRVYQESLASETRAKDLLNALNHTLRFIADPWEKEGATPT